MEIRKGTIEEFKLLWKYSESTTYRYFLGNITSKNTEFWTVDLDGLLVGELYIFFDSPDKDEANGVNRAYLCAFRINKEYQNKGYGQLLMSKVLDRTKELGITEVTIGIDNREYDKLHEFYSKFGFNEVVKEKTIDLHYLNKRGKPQQYMEPYKLMIRKEEKR